MLETLIVVSLLGAIQVWWQRREARRLGITWSRYLRMTAEERRRAGVRI